MPPRAKTPTRRGRSSSAAPAESAKVNGTGAADTSEVIADVVDTASGLMPVEATPAKGKSNRPRVSVIPEEGSSNGIPPATPSTRTLRTRAKTPTKDEAPVPASTGKRSKRESTPTAAKKPRLSALPKPPKIGMNALPEPFGAIRNFPQFTFDYKLAHEADPTASNGQPLALMIFGTGDFGQLGLGVDFAGEEIQRPLLHSWFQEKLGSKQNGQVTEDQSNGAATSVLGKYGLEDAACGGMHTLVIDSNGQIWSWGIGDNGVLGRVVNDPSQGTTEELETTPHPVKALVDEDFRAVRIAAGDSISLAISDKGELRAWGSFRSNEGLLGFDGTPGSPQIQFLPISLPAFKNHPVVQVVCGTDHVLALTTDGHVFSHGNGQQSQLGRKIIERRKINGLTPERLALKNIVLVGTGAYHSFAVDKKGTVYAWGLNSCRQTGIADKDGGMESIIHTPTPVAALEPKLHNGAKVVAIAAGEHYTLFLFENGEVYSCGSCTEHQTGLGPDHPLMEALKEEGAKVKKQQLEFRQAEEPKLIETGQTADEAMVNALEAATKKFPSPLLCIEEPTLIAFPASDLITGQATKIVRIACGTRHSMAVSSTGEVYGWGYANQHQLGLGDDDEEFPAPKRIRSKDLKAYRVLLASTGGQHSLLLASHIEDGIKA